MPTSLTAEQVAQSVWKLCQNDQDFEGAAALIRALVTKEKAKLSHEVSMLQTDMQALKKRDNLRANEIGRLRKINGCKPSVEVRKTLSNTESYNISRNDVHAIMMRNGGLELLIPEDMNFGSEPLNYVRKCRLLDLLAAHACHTIEDFTEWAPMATFPKEVNKQVELRFKSGQVALGAWMYSPNCGRYDLCGFSRDTGIVLPFNEPATHWREIKK